MQESKDIQLIAKFVRLPYGCGLMQESKDIQLHVPCSPKTQGCGLMQESKDIQPEEFGVRTKEVVV